VRDYLATAARCLAWAASNITHVAAAATQVAAMQAR
jgi:hypothetical protein